jgi:hypothetical protein
MVIQTKIDEVERLSAAPEAQPRSSHSRPRPTEGAGARARASRSGTATPWRFASVPGPTAEVRFGSRLCENVGWVRILIG